MINSIHLKKHSIFKYIYKFKKNDYLIIDNFFESQIYEQIIKTNFEIQTVSTHELANKKVRDILISGEGFGKYNDFFQGKKFMKFLGLIYGIDIIRERDENIDFNGGEKISYDKKLSLGAQMYDSGCFFDWHVDGAYSNENTSVGAAIFYLYSEPCVWKKCFGGCLELDIITANKANYKKVILPVMNRLVLIRKTDTAFHRVTKVESQKFRISLQTTLLKK